MPKIALRNVRVFDGERLLEPGTVIIEGDRIGADSADAQTYEGGGVLLPGLIDCHIHLTDESTLTSLARNGVTTGLDMGTWPPELVASLRNLPGVTDVRSAGTGATHPESAHAKRVGYLGGVLPASS
jgi:imidazolonepropionase-like amidohydrolase